MVFLRQQHLQQVIAEILGSWSFLAGTKWSTRFWRVVPVPVHTFRREFPSNSISSRQRMFWCAYIQQAFTLPETNIAPENRPSQKEHNLPTTIFQGPNFLFQGGYMSIECMTSWWFQTFFIFTPIWGRFPIWLIFFTWVETTNKFMSFIFQVGDNHFFQKFILTICPAQAKSIGRGRALWPTLRLLRITSMKHVFSQPLGIFNKKLGTGSGGSWCNTRGKLDK